MLIIRVEVRDALPFFKVSVETRKELNNRKEAALKSESKQNEICI